MLPNRGLMPNVLITLLAAAAEPQPLRMRRIAHPPIALAFTEVLPPPPPPKKTHLRTHRRQPGTQSSNPQRYNESQKGDDGTTPMPYAPPLPCTSIPCAPSAFTSISAAFPYYREDADRGDQAEAD